MREDLEAVADEWRGDQPERGFAMALDTLFALDDTHAVFLVGFAPDGSPAGLPALRALPCVALAVAVVDAQAALDAERLQRVADLRRSRLGARARLRLTSR